MANEFQVDHLDVDRLLEEWRWLCSQPVTLVARSVFGDLFLLTNEGKVLWLEITFGKLTDWPRRQTSFVTCLRVPKTANNGWQKPMPKQQRITD